MYEKNKNRYVIDNRFCISLIWLHNCGSSYFDWWRRATISHYQRACWHSLTSVWWSRVSVNAVADTYSIWNVAMFASCQSRSRRYQLELSSSRPSWLIKACPFRDNVISFHISILVWADRYWYFKTIVWCKGISRPPSSLMAFMANAVDVTHAIKQAHIELECVLRPR